MDKVALSIKTMLSAGREASLHEAILKAYPEAMRLKKIGIPGNAKKLMQDAADDSQAYFNMMDNFGAKDGHIRSVVKDSLSGRRESLKKPGMSKDLVNRIVNKLDVNMNKKAFLEGMYDSAFEDELEKISANNDSVGREYLSRVGGITAAVAPTAAVSAAVAPGLNKRIRRGDMRYYPSPHKSENLSKLKKSMGVSDDINVYKNTKAAYKGGGGAYDAFGQLGPKKAVHYVADKKTTPFQRAILSHELGHSKNYKKLSRGVPLMGLRGAGMIGAIGGTVGASFSGDKDAARKAAIGGTALGVAGFAEEGVATARGVKGLTKYYGGGKKGFKKALFKGKGGGARMIGMNLASYGGLAAAPAIAYKVRKWIKGDK